MAGLNVVALISGGKDSFFSILHCQANGHRVVALANLHPPARPNEDHIDDLDSFMYQTVGHTVIPLYSEALGLPLYRQPITGHAVNQEKHYGRHSDSSADADDETEALVPLLRKVVAAQPEVNAVCTGAILSDYQRTRIESISVRLGLTPLSYLWQWPLLPPHTQASLLEDMAAVGQDSRIIKVASGGLDESFLWQNVSDRRTISRLTRAAERFGAADDGAVLGEGGEYETLALSGPTTLWKGRICVPSDGITAIPGDAGSASLRIRQPFVGPIDRDAVPAANLRRPPLLDQQFQDLLDGMPVNMESFVPGVPVNSALRWFPGAAEHQDGNIVSICNQVSGEKAVDEQTNTILDRMLTELHAVGHRATNVVYTTIVLRNAADFARVNAVYAEYFGHTNPPARVTVACADVLPSNALLMVSLTSVLGAKEGLHVQSRSYWAPANIGPYSQAIGIAASSESTAPGMVFVAGQIPLVPASMKLVSFPFKTSGHDLAYQCVLALQHLKRIGTAMKVAQWAAAIVFVATSLDEEKRPEILASLALHAWKSMHNKGAPPASPEESEDFDIWDVKHGSGHARWPALHSMDSSSVQGQSIPDEIPPLYVVRVDSLPRESHFEWVGLGQRTIGDCALPMTLQSLLNTFRQRTVLEFHDVLRDSGTSAEQSSRHKFSHP